ncbi:ELWxxDGT repeat protein [Calothrix sp. PCC 7507]|uniref:ELWxxDGT repeat protein n=1 Tax=Calothrix sp. PCC 7507 TaxID=99598 RepID=UPI00029F1E04|nr:ELWxxDGT repeat protein [Calothrix sp. PCC 7507]AFY33244.1 FG-GAP repeat-containing protein [Calothrix sp. PCC 7507]
MTTTTLTLVKDILTGSDSSNPNSLTNVNGTLYFSATDGTNGFELWKSDGTAAGTVLVKDIFTGTNGSNPYNLTNVNKTLYFTAYDATNGFELWKSDGTAAGTVLVKDIVAGANGSSPNNLTNVNSTLYFVANDGMNGRELWKSDGTEAGTVLVKDILTGANGSSPNNLTNVNGTLYFVVYDDTNGSELWKSDGTANGTVLVKDIRTGAGNSSSPEYLTNVNGILYFLADDGTNGRELWKSDGTEAGTVLVKDILTGVNGSSPNNLTNVNGTLYFVANDGTNGYELWKSDGTANGTVLVKDIFTGSDSSDLSKLTNVNGTLYFQADDGTNGFELWKSDGTANGTVLVKDINIGTNGLGANGSDLSNLTNVNGTLYFQATDGTNGYKLWKSDGTAAGTVRVLDINPGNASSYPANLTVVNGKLYFTANNGQNGTELFTINIDEPNDNIPSRLTNPSDDVFNIKSQEKNVKTKLEITLTGCSSNLLNELGLFTVDDDKGTINGIAPGAEGYAKAALERSRVIFSVIVNAPNGLDSNNFSSLLELNSEEKFRFLLVKNSTFDAVKTGATAITELLFSSVSTQKITDLGDDGFSLAWRDGSGASATDFSNLVVKIKQTTKSLTLGTNLQGKSQGEVIDLREAKQSVTANFSVHREAAFNNFVGFYQVADENGGIDTNGDGKADVLTGQAGYIQAALGKRVAGIDLSVSNQGAASYSGVFQPGAIFAPFIIVNGSPDALLDSNPNNDPAIYFPFLGANSDKSDHIRLLGNNTFGFEDLANGGDRDFNDIIVKVNLTAIA